MSHPSPVWRDWRWRPAGCRPLAGVEVLSDGKVIGDARLAATAEDVVLADVQFLHGEADPANHWVLKQRRFRRARRLPGTALLLAVAAGRNYYHWLIESVPRLRAAEAAGWTPARLDHVLINENPQPFHTATLARLGFRPEQIRPCHKRELLRVDRLIVPPVPGPPGEPEPYVPAFLRERLSAPPAEGPRRRLFLSRAGINRRHLVNEAEVLAALRPQGFEAIRPEELTFDQQAAVFGAAEAIAGVHGAAFANLVFAPPGARVIELMPPGYDNPCFANLARHAGLNFRRLEGAPAGRTSPHPEQRDLRIAPEGVSPCY